MGVATLSHSLPPENCHFRAKNRLVAMINWHQCRSKIVLDGFKNFRLYLKFLDIGQNSVVKSCFGGGSKLFLTTRTLLLSYSPFFYRSEISFDKINLVWFYIILDRTKMTFHYWISLLNPCSKCFGPTQNSFWPLEG